MMKHLFAAASIAAVSATAAFADNEVDFDINANIETICNVTQNGSGVVTFDDLATTPSSSEIEESGGSLTYRCNSAAGFDREISSDNGGFLFRDGTSGGGANQIAYRTRHGGGSGLGFAAEQLTAPKTTSLGGSTAFLSGQTGSILFAVNGQQDGSGTSVFAGDYSDVVTVEVTAN